MPLVLLPSVSLAFFALSSFHQGVNSGILGGTASETGYACKSVCADVSTSYTYLTNVRFNGTVLPDAPSSCDQGAWEDTCAIFATGQMDYCNVTEPASCVPFSETFKGSNSTNFCEYLCVDQAPSIGLDVWIQLDGTDEAGCLALCDPSSELSIDCGVGSEGNNTAQCTWYGSEE